MLKKIFGFITFISGLAILGWGGYNFFFPQPEFSMRGPWQLVAPVFFVILGYHWMTASVFEPMAVDKSDPLMQEAVAQARANVSLLKAALERGAAEVIVKFSVTGQDLPTEHIWGAVQSWTDTDVTVMPLSRLVYNPPVTGPVTVSFSELQDWAVPEDGKLRGGYTDIAMIKIHERDLGQLPKPLRQRKESLLDYR
jgi:uncharacterized protein YegJ (DUF2314 family)